MTTLREFAFVTIVCVITLSPYVVWKALMYPSLFWCGMLGGFIAYAAVKGLVLIDEFGEL